VRKILLSAGGLYLLFAVIGRFVEGMGATGARVRTNVGVIVRV
jgi:hypothetical protein